MGVLLIVLKWIGIVILSLIIFVICLLGIVLFVPARYSGEYVKTTEEDSLVLRFRLNWLLFVARYHVLYENGNFSQSLKIFGIKINLKKKDPEEKKQSNIKKNKKKKKSNIFFRIKKFKETVLNKDNVLALKILIQELKHLFKHWGPRKLKATLSFCLGDPAHTGIALGIISVFPIVYKEDVLLKSDFESDRIYLIGRAKFQGHFRAFHAVKLMFNLFKKNESRNILSIIKK